jgi:endoglucanase
MVEGPEYSLRLEDFGRLPVRLSIPHRLVYSPHNYGWSQKVPQNYEEFKKALDHQWGYLLSGEGATPIWLGEIGVCQNLADCREYGQWFDFLVQYIDETGAGWSYWALNGTQSSGAGRLYGNTESYGLLTTDYRGVAAPDVLKRLEKAGLAPQEKSNR